MVRKKKENVNAHLGQLPIPGKYSMKNIPIPTKAQYMKQLTSATKIRNSRKLRSDQKFVKSPVVLPQHSGGIRDF